MLYPDRHYVAGIVPVTIDLIFAGASWIGVGFGLRRPF
jgi:hypothetical protein